MSFPLFFDEHVHQDLAKLLVDSGHDVLTTRNANRANQRISDDDQLALAARSGRVLVTYNGGDFYVLAINWQREGWEYPGIIVCDQRPTWELLSRFLVLFALYPDGWPPNLCMRLP